MKDRITWVIYGMILREGLTSAAAAIDAAIWDDNNHEFTKALDQGIMSQAKSLAEKFNA